MMSKILVQLQSFLKCNCALPGEPPCSTTHLRSDSTFVGDLPNLLGAQTLVPKQLDIMYYSHLLAAFEMPFGIPKMFYVNQYNGLNVIVYFLWYGRGSRVHFPTQCLVSMSLLTLFQMVQGIDRHGVPW